MDCFETYYSLNRKLLLSTGMWPNEKSKKMHFRTYFITFFIVTGCFQQGVRFYTVNLNLDAIIETLYVVLPGLCIVVCYYNAVFSPSKIIKIIECIDHDWGESVDKQDLIVMQQYARESKICTVIIVGTFYSFVFFLISPSVFRVFMYNLDNRNDTTLTLPMPVENIIGGSMTYYMLLLHQILTITIVTTIAAAIYTSFLMCIQHACTLFIIITLRINRPFQEDRNYFEFSDEVEKSYDWVVDVTKRYEEAIKFVGHINTLSENAYLVEVIMVMFLFVIDFLYLFQIPTLMNNIVEALSIFIYIPGSIGVMYMNCYLGQKLMDHSMQVLETSSHVPFYNIPLKCHKPLLLMIIRSMKPCKLSIGGLFACSHNFFFGLMQKSYSYAMICYTMR